MALDPFAVATDIAARVAGAGGRAYIVGGFVRDRILHEYGKAAGATKDIDIEVFGLGLQQLVTLLRTCYAVDMVGASFGVLKIHGTNVDVALPRRDSKVRDGHRGFEVLTDPGMTLADSARRRDFTMNALLLDPLTNELADPFGGIDDIRNGTLRAVDPGHFAEDPLRVLRAMQFAARFRMRLDPSTTNLCRSIELKGLSRERIGEEWRKLLLQSEKPSIGLQLGSDLGIMRQLHTDLHALAGVEQRADYHPEGDVWTHTCLAVDAAAKLAREQQLDARNAFELLVATLCHDLGKAQTTYYNQKQHHMVSYGHESAGVEPAKRVLYSIHAPKFMYRSIPKLVRYHMFPPRSRHSNAAELRQLASLLQPTSLLQLCRVALADQYGRGYVSPQSVEQVEHLLERASRLQILHCPLPPLVRGRHLLQRFPDLRPGIPLGKLLGRLYQAQLNGAFATREDGLKVAGLWLAKDDGGQ